MLDNVWWYRNTCNYRDTDEQNSQPNTGDNKHVRNTGPNPAPNTSDLSPRLPGAGSVLLAELVLI